jgi:hypothetical protein
MSEFTSSETCPVDDRLKAMEEKLAEIQKLVDQTASAVSELTKIVTEEILK